MDNAPYPINFYKFCKPTDPSIKQSCEANYYQTGYAAKLIHSVLKNSGFKKVEDLEEANLIVGGKLQSEGEECKHSYQRTNHYENTFSLGSKAGYHHAMRRLEARIKEMPSFYPETYLLPAERDQMLKAFPSSPLWIQKPAGGSRGNGISVIDKPPAEGFKKVVIQKYLDHPLLINGLKFDLRFYVAITSLIPLKIYVFNNGLVRLATEPYEENHDKIGNKSVHLTNFSINKENENFHATNDISEDGKGNKWSHVPFWPWMKEHGFNVDEIRHKIEDAFVTTIMASRSVFCQQERLRESFELFGFDVILSQTGDIHILEVNVSPALGTSSNLDMFIKAPLVKDLFNIALVPEPSPEEEFIEQLMQERNDEKSCSAIAICEYEETLRRLGGFTCIYPTVERLETHKKYLGYPEFEDEALAKWINSNDEQKEAYLRELLTHLYSVCSKHFNE
ncbi:Tubulin-tyrosine ligase family protein [Trichomonas vaginalis G3]|uniref:Tubulin-tyrosine ligase family protein n=2 Tax=Trichomonas vaginalis (strain ATCC PRA-98 / G3) TaxID=412133 RepID=A2E4K0_TRIV3|nr:Tubulin-tyrosine ligase family protein [Trichomonas vaginalis G3]|eukprot:XP_001324645.1 Tubulin-tyrosine ligase family protein [Trichomonas vaginalis G3]